MGRLPVTGARGSGAGARPAGLGLGRGAGTWVLAAAVLLLALLAGHRTAYRGRIQPGVRVGQVAVGGLRPDAAEAALAAGGFDPSAPVTLRAGDVVWSVSPADVGLVLDSDATVAAAYRVGRSSRLGILRGLVGRLSQTEVRPVVTLQRDAARRGIEQLADGFDVAAADASLAVVNLDVRATEPVEGRALNVDGALAKLASQAASGTWPMADVVLPYNTIHPEVTDVAGAADIARRLLAAPVTLRRASQSWVLQPAVMAGMLTATVQSGVVGLGLLDGPFTDWMSPVLEAVSQTAEAPRFHFVPETGELELVSPGRPGTQVDLAGTAARVVAAEDSPSRSAQVAVIETRPAISDTVTASQLGIRELVDEETSRFVGSPSERVHNIGVAAGQFDGLLVPPGTVFSFNDNLGDVTAERGYMTTLIIMDGTTTDGVGGGVCQVSTTLFRAALSAGLPIVERQAHGYRVAYYEQGADVGLDATVFSPQVDLKFQNDTTGWLLIETTTDDRAMTVTFRLWGTRPDREVEILPAVVTNQVPAPPPTVVVDPDLPAGQTRVLENQRAGASASVTRVIRENGTERRETFYSKYRPTGRVTAVSAADYQPPAEAPSEAGAAPPATSGELPGTDTTP